MSIVKAIRMVPVPPVGVAPLLLVVIFAPLGFGRTLRPVLPVQFLPHIRMILEILLQGRVLVAPVAVVEQARIVCEGLSDVRMVGQEVLKALVALVLLNVVEPRVTARETGNLRHHKLSPRRDRECESKQNRA